MSKPAQHPENSDKTLYDVAVNQRVRVKAISAEAAVCQRLREMGFCEFAEVRKVSHGSALVCHVCGVNVALNKYLAKNILVEAIPSRSQDKQSHRSSSGFSSKDKGTKAAS